MVLKLREDEQSKELTPYKNLPASHEVLMDPKVKMKK
jgi:hypothetical protein